MATRLPGTAVLPFAGGHPVLILPLRGGSEGVTALTRGPPGRSGALVCMAGRLAPPGLVARGGPIRAFGVTCAIAAIAVLGALLVLAPVRRGDLRAVAGARFAGAATTDGAPTRLCTVTAVAHAAILLFGPWRIARGAKVAGAPRGDRVAI